MNETLEKIVASEDATDQDITMTEQASDTVADATETADPAPAERMAESVSETVAGAQALPALSAEEEAQRAEVEAKINALEIKYRKKPIHAFFKRIIDFTLALIGLLLLSPVFLIIAILIKCDDGGKVFYKHKRIGRGGKTIYIHKFRSMRKNADQLIDQLTPEQLHQYYTEFKIDNDPRITKIGNFLRRTSLDELPQIIDILLGKISIIGPRPLVDVETELYYNKRDLFLSVKPGLTGYWQAYARNEVGYADGERQKMELHYVEKRSLWFDIKIFFKTIFSVLKRKGAK